MLTLVFKVLFLVSIYRQAMVGGKRKALLLGLAVAAVFSLLKFPWFAVAPDSPLGILPWAYFGLISLLYFVCAPAVLYAYWRYDGVSASSVIAASGGVLLIFLVPLGTSMFLDALATVF